MCTVHQPSSQVFELFDKLILMAQGSLAYLGPTEDAKAFIEMTGYPCPSNYNPADHILHTLAIVPGEEDFCREKINRICDDYESSDLSKEGIFGVSNPSVELRYASLRCPFTR